MKNLVYLSFLCFSILLVACGDDEPSMTSVEGNVLEFGSNIPIANAQVYLDLGTGSGGLMSGPNIIRTESVTTDVDGHYSFSFETEAFPYRNLYAEHDQYFDAEDLPFVIVGGRENSYDIIMDPHAWLKLHIKNVNPVDESDNIQYSGPWGGGSPNDNFGMDVDFIDVKSVRGNRDRQINWWVIKNNITNQFDEVVYCPANDTILFEIFY